jgi:S1-C subfamily serine protease
VEDTGPAKKGGIQPNDVFVEVDGMYSIILDYL